MRDYDTHPNVRAALPPDLRMTLADRINPTLAIIVAVSVLAHGIAAYWLYQRDVKVKTRLELVDEVSRAPAVTDQYVEIIVPADAIPEPPPSPGVAAPVGGDTATPDVDPVRAHRPRVTSTPRLSDADIDDIIDNSRALAVLSKRGGTDSPYSKMVGKDGASDLDRAIRNVDRSGDTVVARADGWQTRDSAPADIGRRDGPVVDGPTRVDVAPDKDDDSDVAPPDLGPIEPLGPGANPEAIARTIRRRYLKGIQRCHATLLGKDPTAGGRLDIEITTSTVGQVVDVSVSGFDASLDRCVETLAKRWRFSPATENGAPVEATYLVPFILKAPGR